MKSSVPASREYCFKCLPEGKDDTSGLLRIVGTGNNLFCENCETEYTFKQGYTTRKYCMKCRSNVRNQTQKLKAVNYLGGKCAKCSYNKYIGALNFHHIDPEQKSFGIGKNLSLGWDKLKKELDKCQLLCANCHAEHHGGVVE